MESSSSIPPTVRLGLVGLKWGERVARAAAALPNVSITGCFARTAAGRDQFAARHGCEAYASFAAMLGDSRLDGIVVMTPNGTHRELTVAALEAGKHVLVTKPIAASLVDASAIISAAHTHRRIVAVGHQARRHAGLRALKSLLDRGALGRPVMIEANTSSPTGFLYAHSWRESAADCPGGPLLQLGIHAIDNFQYLLGPILEVSSFQRRVSPGGDLPEITHTVCLFEGGATGSLASSYVSPWTRWLRLTGTDAMAWVDGADGAWVLRSGKPPEQVAPLIPNEEIIAQAMAGELADFVQCIRTGDTPEIDGAVGARNLAVVLAAVESNRRRAVVAVAELWSDARS
jgi:UDP-N-acetyl-2-amino-2-deoxyglucuronate dehydrogenase